MNFGANHFHFKLNQMADIVKRLDHDGYAIVQFSDEQLPSIQQGLKPMENFFRDFIEQIGGQCLNHNGDKESIVWHVQPKETSMISKQKYLARSHTSEEFFFHTDCSYEMNPAEYIALFVLEKDQLDGGQFEIIRLSEILEMLSSDTKEKLSKNNVRINVPSEFRMSPDVDHIMAPIIFDHEKIRYRHDIVSEMNCKEFTELNAVINKVTKYRPVLNKHTMILLNNHKYLHGRTKILDSRRHLLRIRFNRSLPYDTFSVYNKTKLLPEYLTLSNDFYDYLEHQHQYLFKILDLIVKQYSQPTDLGTKIRQTFQFDTKIHDMLIQLNIHRPNFKVGSYRPDIIFGQGSSFKINGVNSFHPKICEINARFPFNAYFLSAALCSTDKQNRLSKNYSKIIDKIVRQSKFDTNKPMFILKSREYGFDIHLFQQYWSNRYSQSCSFIDPKQLKIENGKLIDKDTNCSIEQFVLELHQNEILDLSDDILEFFIQNKDLNYMNDLRTIFIVHDKRLFALLSNQQFLYALLNNPCDEFKQFIPTTFVINKIPSYLKDSILANRQHWCIKPNSSGKGENVTIGIDVTFDEWSRQLLDTSHDQWIVQQYIECVQYNLMNISGMLLCFDSQCFNIGMIRLSPNKIVNICHGGWYIRPYIHREHIHSMNDDSVLNKTRLHEQIIELKSIDTNWNKSVYFSSSGGSGGKRLFFATDIKQNQLQRKILVDTMLEQNIINDSDVCLNLFYSNNMYRAFEIFNDFCTMANCTALPMGGNTNDEDILHIIEYFKPNILMGSPYRLMQFALFVEKQMKTEIHFEKIYFACDALDDFKRNYLKHIFNCSIFIGFYGSAEAGVFACQLPKYSSTKIYLYPKELVNIEIIDSKIVVTNLIRKRNQLIRFNTGDLGRLIEYDKNEKYGLVEVFSSERLITIKNSSLSKADFENIMKQIDLIEWQMIISQVPHTKNDQTLLLFRYVKTQLVSMENVENYIEDCIRKFYSKTVPNLSEQLKLQFEAVPFHELIRDKASHKLLKIIDRRS